MWGLLYLISKLYSASRTFAEKNIAAVTDVHRNSEKNTSIAL